MCTTRTVSAGRPYLLGHGKRILPYSGCRRQPGALLGLPAQHHFTLSLKDN